jgi:hypothetical protein
MSGSEAAWSAFVARFDRELGDGRPETPAIGDSIIGPGRQQGPTSFTRDHVAEVRREDSP